MNLRDDMIAALIEAKISSPRLEADIILKYAAPNYPEFSGQEKTRVQEMLSRRINHEPLDKIIGQKEFYKSVFKVNQDVLSPRPDTEILVESALKLINKSKSCNILDLGTGSGCIILSLLKELPLAKGVGLDISEKALKIADLNANNLGVSDRVEWLLGSWQEPQKITGQFEIIVSNPPYIESKEIETLDREVKDFDPLLALDGGKDGFDCYRDIAKITPAILKEEGCILLEVGYNQADRVRQIFENQNLNYIETVKDLANIDRCVILSKNSCK